MRLDREAITRHDFDTSKEGYDPDAVDRHLAAIADAAEAADRGRLGEEAQEELASIVEGAQRSADALREQAEAEAGEIREAARRQAEGEANEQAARQIARAEAAVTSVLERVEALGLGVEEVQATVRERGEALSRALGEAAEPLLKTLEDRASALAAELALMGTGLAPGTALRAEEEEAEHPQTDADAGSDEPYEADDEEPPGAEDSDEGAGSGSEGDGTKGRVGVERARLVALNMALAGTPREETARELRERFDLPDAASILDEVYERAEQAN